MTDSGFALVRYDIYTKKMFTFSLDIINQLQILTN